METAGSQKYILTVNAGSSSVKLALCTADGARQVTTAAVGNIGQASAQLTADTGASAVIAPDHTAAAALLIDWLKDYETPGTIVAVGHRVVHGGPDYHETQIAHPETLRALRQLAAFSPAHLPIELQLVEAFQRALPHAQNVLCFDTAFHWNLPTRSRLLPVPRQLAAKGLRRYGFHGLSYAYIVEELRRIEGESAVRGKVIIAHLGSGASLAALAGGKPVDTTMSMTPASGIPMSTRSGDLDPGLLLYLARAEGYDTDRQEHLVNFESGLLGISETSADMKQLLTAQAGDPRAEEAVDVFCYSVTKTIGAFAAALGGLNTLVFTGGMGENAPKVRAQVCRGLEFLGIALDGARNQAGERLISADGAAVGVHVIHTNEAVTIARETANLLNKKGWV